MRISLRMTIVAALLFFAGNVWAQATKEVQVVNTAANPVPVAGIVSISGTPTVKIQNDVPEPFSGFSNETIGVGWANTILTIGTIPVGQRLVIEHVAVNCTCDSDDSIPFVKIYIYRKVIGGWQSFGVPLLAQKQGNTYDGKASWTASQQVRLYSDGVDAPTNVDVYHSKTAATASCYAVVTGHTLAAQ